MNAKVRLTWSTSVNWKLMKFFHAVPWFDMRAYAQFIMAEMPDLFTV